MKLNLQTKTEKQNLLGLLITWNTIASSLIFILLLVQFWFFPVYFGITWTAILGLITSLAFFNLRYLRTNFRLKHLWEWLKTHR